MQLPVLPLAHGLVQRADLPLPEDVFIITAAVVLAVSFVALAVLWSKPLLENAPWPELPGALAWFFGSTGLRVALGVIGVFLLGVTLFAAFEGPKGPQDNFAPTFVYVIFWVGL